MNRTASAASTSRKGSVLKLVAKRLRYWLRVLIRIGVITAPQALELGLGAGFIGETKHTESTPG